MPYMAISLRLCVVMVMLSYRGLAPILSSGAFESQCRSAGRSSFSIVLYILRYTISPA